jgi:hypothetical protein
MLRIDCMNDYNENWIKHRAKGIKREKQIAHHEALDQASQEAGFTNWKNFLNSETTSIHPGILVCFKAKKWMAIAVGQIGESVICYTHWGTLRCLRSEISICRDQTGASSFRPMRIVLPYGKWRCADGTEVLFNRDYRPIWKKHPNGAIVAADPDEWINFSKQEYFFGDHNSPDENRDSYRTCINQLQNWGVEQKVPVMLDLFRQAVAAGDLTRLRKQNIFDN